MDAATVQMKDSGLFDHRFMREWERKPEAEKTWPALKTYFTEEYEAIIEYDEPTKKSFESIKTAMDEIVKLNKTVAKLTQTNKTLVETIAAMGGARKTDIKENQERSPAGSGKCPHCHNFHKKPFEEHCFKLNDEKRPPGWGQGKKQE